MKKKLYLRIQALALVCFITLSTCIIVPQQIHADETFTAVEESTETAIGTAVQNETGQTEAETEPEAPNEAEATETEFEPNVPNEAEQPEAEAEPDIPNESRQTVASAEDGAGTRNSTPEEFFEFDSETGTITNYVGTDTDVIIPSLIGDVTVTRIGEQAFYNKD